MAETFEKLSKNQQIRLAALQQAVALSHGYVDTDAEILKTANNFANYIQNNIYLERDLKDR